MLMATKDAMIAGEAVENRLASRRRRVGRRGGRQGSAVARLALSFLLTKKPSNAALLARARDPRERRFIRPGKKLMARISPTWSQKLTIRTTHQESRVFVTAHINGDYDARETLQRLKSHADQVE